MPEPLPPTPAAPRRGLHLDRGNLFLVIGGAIVVLLLTLSAAWPDVRRVAELIAISEQGLLVDGQITGVAQHSDPRGERVLAVSYRFVPRAAGASTVSATLAPASDSWRVGTRVQVRYLAEDPRRSFIEGYRATDVLARLFGSGLLVLLVLAGLGLTWREWRQQPS